MRTRLRIGLCLSFALLGMLAAQGAELSFEGPLLRVSGLLDGSELAPFAEQLQSGKVRTVVFEDVLGGSAQAAALYVRAIQASRVNTEVIGQCQAACAYAFLAGRRRHFDSRHQQVSALLIPVSARPRPGELGTLWRGDEAFKALYAAAGRRADGAGAAAPQEPLPPEKWQPDQGVLFTATPTLFGSIYNTFYCDGTQGRDFSRCELLSDADPYKLGVLTE